MTIYAPTTQIKLAPVPTGDWFWIKPDPLLPSDHKYYPIRVTAPNPCVFNLGEADFLRKDALKTHSCPFNKAWQFFAADLICYSGFGVPYFLDPSAGELNPDLTAEQIKAVKKCFTGTFSKGIAFNNTSGFPDRANYITGEDLDQQDPSWDKIRICGTNSHKGEIVENSANVKMVHLEVFDFDSGPPVGYDIEILTDPRIGWASIIYEGGNVGRFPRRGLPLYTDIPWPIVARKDVYYPLDYMKQILDRRMLYVY